MEPITTAAAAAAGLFAVKLLEEAGSQTGKALSAAVGRLAAWVRRRGERDAETGAAVTMVVADPTDQRRIELLGRILGARATADPEFGQELVELVAQARQAGDTLVIRDQAQLGTVVTGSSIGGQGGHGLAGGGGGGPAFGGGAGGDGGPGGNIYIPPGSPEPAVASGAVAAGV